MLQKAARVLAALVNDEILIFNFAGCQSAGDVRCAFALGLNYVTSIAEKVGNTFAKIIRSHKSKYREGEVYCLQRTRATLITPHFLHMVIKRVELCDAK